MIENQAKGTILHEKLEKEVVFNISKLFALYGMTLGENLRHYWVDLLCLPGSLYTIEAGWQNKKKFVLIHGFGANSLCFFRLIPFLAKNYHVYAFDLYGMGLSTRVKFDCEDSDEVLQKMLLTIEEWRMTLKIEQFDILAHSFGAYLASHYVNLYEPKIGRLYLTSPAGFTKTSFKKEEDAEDKFNFIETYLYKTCMQEQKKTPFEVLGKNYLDQP
jgi:pimeloyl-ACP methyl ester carboxylesterase